MAKVIPWNYAKFLVDPQGDVYGYYTPNDEPNAMINDIEKLLKVSVIFISIISELNHIFRKLAKCKNQTQRKKMSIYNTKVGYNGRVYMTEKP